MSGHTPGPWSASEVRHGYDQIVRNRDYAPVASVCLAGYAKPCARANANLIAAAPDLLAALHRAAEALDAYSDVNDGEDGPTPNRAMSALQEIGIVIAKAEGKPR